MCQESRQLDHAGLGLGGEETALHMAEILERAERWLREKGTVRDSRTGHELSVLTNALYQGGVYNQLNVGGLGCLEVICRRIAVLVEAYSQPSRPNWTAARYLEGAPMSEEVILPRLRSYAMRRAKEEVDIQTVQQRSYTRSSANDDDKDVRGRQRCNQERGVEGVSSRRQMDDSSGCGTGNCSSLAAVPRAMRSPGEQPRLPFCSGSRDLFPLMWDPHRALPPKGKTQRVETLRRHLVVMRCPP